MASDSRIESLLRERTRFERLHHVASCSSTQEMAAQDAAAGDRVYWADHQTRGRGRQQREWHDEPAADLTATFRVTVGLPKPLALPAALPVAVLQACEQEANLALTIKWPNDLYLDDKKLSGVLIDAGIGRPDTYLIGVGINCNRVRFPPDLEHTATSLALATGREVDRSALLLTLAERVDTMLRDLTVRRHAELESVFRQRLWLIGQRVRIDAGVTHEGVVADIDFEQIVLEHIALPLAVVRGIQRL